MSNLLSVLLCYVNFIYEISLNINQALTNYVVK